MIRPASAADAEAIAAMYRPTVLDTAISFETVPPGPAEMERRIAATLEIAPWLVYEEQGKLGGYAYGSRHRERAAYQWSVDVSVYVHEAFRRRGIGSALYKALFPLLRLQGFFAALARRRLLAAFAAGSRSGAAATPPDGRGAAGSGVAGGDGGRAVAAGPGYFGCCVIRRYGFGAFQPCGNCFFASSSLTEPEMMTSPPCFQLAGVATLCFAVSWIESMTRRTSSKFRPVVIGEYRTSLIFLSAPMTNTVRTVALSAGVRVFASPETEAGSMS